MVALLHVSLIFLQGPASQGGHDLLSQKGKSASDTYGAS